MTSLDSIFNSPIAKLLDFLYKNDDRPYTISEITKKGNISKRTVQRYMSQLIAEGFIVEVGRNWYGKLYTLNRTERVLALAKVLTISE